MPCLQAPKQANCNGPYSATPCPACLGREGQCLKSKPSQGCAGPFSPSKCAYCKNQENNGLVAPSVRTYLASLQLDSVSLQHVFTKTCGYSPAQIDKKYNKLNDPNLPCPWVEIGNLYMSVTVTGEGSWGQLIDRLYKIGKRRFAVFTGRHGLEVGTVVQDLNSKQFGAGIADAAHVVQDLAQKPIVEGRHSLKKTGPIAITLFNVGTTPDTTMSRTKQLACECLNVPETAVIFAWCYSLLSCYQLTQQDRDQLTSHAQIACYNKPIKDIASEKFGWADNLGLRNAKLTKLRGSGEAQGYRDWRAAVPV